MRPFRQCKNPRNGVLYNWQAIDQEEGCMDTLLIICTSLLLTSINHFCDYVLPKFFLYEYDKARPVVIRPLFSDKAVRLAGGPHRRERP